METLLEKLVEQDFGISGRNRWLHSDEHDSLVVDRETQTFWWNSRGIVGNSKDYLIKIRGVSELEAEEIVKNFNKISNPVLKKHNIDETPYEKLVDFTWMNGKNHREYWYKRLLTDETIDRYRLGYYDGWYTIPLYEDGTFLNFQIRRDDPKRIKYWYHVKNFKPVLMNSEILNFVDYVWITEGTVDAILLNQLGFPAVAQTGGSGYWNPEWNYLFNKVKEIVYVRDNDLSGIGHAMLVSNNLGAYKVRIVVLGSQDKYDTIDFFRDGHSSDEFSSICSTNYKFSFQLGKDK